ncbi:MAG TPA: SDR family oxidoreductase [Gaiellaceae bacterium]|nr:SDR family oxidoreductase [Gaiellaceae bacterium]
MTQLDALFGLDGRVAVVTGGSGVLGSALARALAGAGAKVALLARGAELLDRRVRELEAQGGEALAVVADVLDRTQIEAARDAVLDRFGRIDVLVNAAGGNVPEATLDETRSFFDLPESAFERVFALNLVGTLLPSQVLGRAIAEREGKPDGCIVNISSMAAQRAISRVVGYSAAKAAVENLTRWLAVDAARVYGGGLRVNAIAPGFFVGEQNRALLLTETGELTPRGRTIVEHTPLGRFGVPAELGSTVVWLCGPGASFVNGVVVPVDGGFNASSGV